MRIDVVNMEKVNLYLSPKEHAKVFNMSFNKLATKARSIARRTMAQEYNIMLKSTKGIAIKKKIGEGGFNVITLWGSSRRLNVVADLKGKDMRPNGIMFNPVRGISALPRAFISNIYGLNQAYERTSTKRLPVMRVENKYEFPRHCDMLTNEKVIDAISNMMNTEGKQEYDKALVYYLGKYASVPSKKLT